MLTPRALNVSKTMRHPLQTVNSNNWDTAMSPRRDDPDALGDHRRSISLDLLTGSSPEENMSPRQTPKHRRSLLLKNQDIIEMYRQHSNDLSESIHSEGRLSIGSVISRETQLCQEREARHLAEGLLDGCQKQLKETESRLITQEEFFRKELDLADAKFSEQQQNIVDLMQKHKEAESCLTDCKAELEELRTKVSEKHETTCDKNLVTRLRKRLEQQEKLIENLCTHADTSSVMESFEAVCARSSSGRQSLEIMHTLSEEDLTEDGGDDEEEDQLKIARLQLALRSLQQEREELRQTADQCWVREQAAGKRAAEMEKENQELTAFTQQMQAGNQRIMGGFNDLQQRLASMVTRERLESLAEDLDAERRRAHALEHSLCGMVSRDALQAAEDELEKLRAALAAAESRAAAAEAQVDAEAAAAAAKASSRSVPDAQARQDAAADPAAGQSESEESGPLSPGDLCASAASASISGSPGPLSPLRSLRAERCGAQPRRRRRSHSSAAAARLPEGSLKVCGGAGGSVGVFGTRKGWARRSVEWVVAALLMGLTLVLPAAAAAWFGRAGAATPLVL